MRRVVSSLFFLLILSISVSGQTFPVHLNSVGFLPNYKKTAAIPQQCKTFKVMDAENGKEVFSGNTSGPEFQKDVNQNVWTADFSALKTPGKYYLEVPGVGKSPEFEIADDVFNFAAKTSYRAFYLWRCGMAVRGEYDGKVYETEACHLNDGYEDYIGNPGSQRDGTGGWHDAGDHGKYIVNAGVTLGVLFYAWDHFKENLEKIDYDLPETAQGFPEFLKELKWETDWVLKMQYPDGSGRVSHKLTRTNFSGFIMPQDDHEKRYFTEWSSAATADFVAMMAMAARYFKPYDAAYAQKCLDAAWVSYRF
ncbi:MAG: glycoside hydrolase family 9 protein, partial [Mariniphaga sp.]|nr:glycoside hydrolase family 9 protein [Mariniphaga sp.]